MSESKKYYWLKLKSDFFDDDTIKFIEEQENGIKYSNFYLKLCLKSLKTDGKLIRLVGETLIPYDINSLSKLTGVEFDTVRSAMQLFESIGLIKVLESGEIYLSQIDELIGSETDKAQMMRRLRAERKLDSNNVTPMLPEIEIDKEIEKEIDKEIDNNIYKKPQTEKPEVENPSVENQGQLNTNKQNTKKEKGKKEKSKTDIDLVIDETNYNDELKNMIYEFIKMRKTIKKPMTTIAVKRLINKLDKFTNNDKEKIQILDKSIFNSWQDIYPLKPEEKQDIEYEHELTYTADDFTPEQYDRLVRRQMSKEEMIQILKEKKNV